MYNYQRKTSGDKQTQLEFEWGKWTRSGGANLDGEESATTPCMECIFKEFRIESLYDEIEEDDDLFNETDKGIMEMNAGSASDLLFGVGDVDLESDDPRFVVEDGLFEKTHLKADSSPLFDVGEVDENNITRRNNSMSASQFASYKKQALKRNIKCKCGTTFFVPDATVSSICPNCENEHAAKTFTIQDALKMRDEKVVNSEKL